MEKDAEIRETEQKRMDVRKKKQRNKKILINILILIISVSLWCAAAYYGYTYAKDYIDTSIRNIQQENAVNIQQLTERMEMLGHEISGLRERIEEADSTLSSSTSVQRRIDRQLGDLEDQLMELDRALQILKEAPNVQN
jgi:flagellar basal body-associated protein FliL